MNGVSNIIQVSAVKMDQHKEVDQFDSFVYSDVPLQSFINGLTGIKTSDIERMDAEGNLYTGEDFKQSYKGRRCRTLKRASSGSGRKTPSS